MPPALEAYDFDTVQLLAPGPNCKFAGFIGEPPEFHTSVEPIDYMALQQAVSYEEDGAETIEAERVIPAIADLTGQLRFLVVGFDGFACVGPDEDTCSKRLAALVPAARAAHGTIAALKSAASAAGATPAAVIDAEVPDAT